MENKNELLDKYNISEQDLYTLGIIEARKDSVGFFEKEKLKAKSLGVLKPYNVKFMDLGNLLNVIKTQGYHKDQTLVDKYRHIDLESITLSSGMKYVIPIIVGIVVFFYIIISTIGGPSGSETSSGSENDAKCSQWDSKNAVEERIESLGHTQVSINLNDKADCRYQWLVQFISRNGASEWCAITTDGSSGVVEIVDVSCN